MNKRPAVRELIVLGRDGNFGDAIEQLKSGNCVSRPGWNGKNMYLELQVPDTHSKMSLPYIFMRTADNNLVPWLASQTDMLAEDWQVVEVKTEGEEE